ncbi:MAG TPA: extracellular solute-binding protein [Candidatus Limnocylindrales bacterium]|nr:extracellular solute-binding protein [Candidatus Limnocylindrales bacterium]
MTKHTFARPLTVIAALVFVVAACGGGATPSPSASAPASAAPPASAPASAPGSAPASAAAGPSQELIDAAKAEGNLTTIALPHDWCNYEEALQSFKDKYGIAINELNPLGSSGDEIEAIKANQNNPGPQAPDVVDVGFSFGEDNKDLFQPYKVATWDSIPEAAKSADGIWYGDYYGVMSFTTNKAIVANPPKDWADLLKPEYKGQVSMDGDPRTSNQAIQAVYASALANGGSLDNAQPGLDFWKKVVDAGNFVPVDANPGTIVQGATPIALRWSYNGLAQRDETAGNPEIDVTVPASGRFGGVYVQAISKYAPHPNAAKLWMEHLYSDEGQLMWLKGYCNPIRYDDMVERGVVPADLAAKLPDSTGAVFPTPDQLKAATDLITKGWDSTVGVDVVEPPQ